uniref:Deuterosome assembly protein 1 n=1 Tax=Anolis carolinensis TaxID=28377 RepID=G1KQC6_ANOCA|nr:PREDICTED: deuterosome protein 1 [Anolis carolinensis]|eukprot:XP_016848175.1 PREDICTED: deuterosome protein 1 [Anolis carolinensis]
MEKKTEALQEERVARSIPCDAELQELMQQIDIMVNNKKLEWEKRLQSLEAKMTVRDQELASAQSKLEQKGQEVGVLRQKLDNLQKSKYELVENYDTQLQGLKTQFSKLTQSYEKLQLHQLKQNKAHVVETFKENEDVPFQMSSLNQKLEEFRAKSREWDKQEMLYQNHLVSLDAQRKLLSEKCNLLQRQTQNYQIQIHYQRPKAEDTDPGNQCKTEHVGVQCDDLPEPVDRSDLFMEKLQSTVSEIAESRNRLQEENLKFRQEVKMYQRRCQTIEAKLTEVTNDLKSRNDLLNMVQMECQRLRQEVTRLEELKSIEASQVKLQSSYAQCVKDLEIKKAQILFLERQQQNQKRELNQIRDRLYQEQQSHCSEVERMRREISDLTEELHQKEITIATIMAKAALLERQLQMELEIKEKMLGKQQRIDLTKKEPKTYWDSSNRASHENERFHNEFVNLPKDSDIPLLVKPIPYFGTNHANPTSVIMQEKKEKPMENENEWTTQSATYEHSRTQIPTWHARGDIFNTESSCALPPQVRSRSREPIADGRSPSPPNVYLERHGTYFPEEPKPGMLLKYTYVAEASQMPSPETLLPATVTEKFRQEEEKRARDFELVLNSHIEELQMQSENTLKKYARFKQNQHR